MINLAHGDVFTVGAFLSLISLLLLSVAGITSVPLALALVFAAAMAGLCGWTIERVAYRPLRGSFRLAPLISAIGMSLVLQNFTQIAQGANVKPMAPLVPGGLQLFTQDGFAVQVTFMQIAIVGHHAGRAGRVHLAGHAHAARAGRCGPASRTSGWPGCWASTPTARSA